MKRSHWATGAHDWMNKCFGRGEHADCDRRCPQECQAHCARYEFTEKYSPRVLREFGKSKNFFPILNAFFKAWHIFDNQLANDSIKISYGLLLTLTRDERGRHDTRWVWKSLNELAVLRGIPLRTFREHVKLLEKIRLIDMLPRRDIDPADRSNRKTIIIRDLPQWWVDFEKFKKSIPLDFEEDDLKWIMDNADKDEEAAQYVSLEEEYARDGCSEPTDDQIRAAQASLNASKQSRKPKTNAGAHSQKGGR